MAQSKRSEFVVGIFVLALLVAAFGVIVWLGGTDMFKPLRQTAVFFTPESSGSRGLEVGSFIQIGDDRIGKISQVTFQPEKARTLYYAQIDRHGVKIHADGKAICESGFVGGTRLIILSRGTEKGPLADEEHPVELKAAGFMAELNTISETVKAELDKTRSDAALAKIHVILNGLQSASTDIARITSNLGAEISIDKADTMLSKLKAAVENVRLLANNIRVETDRAETGSLLAKIHKSATDINEMTDDAKPRIKQTLTAIAETAEQIRAYSRKDVAELLEGVRTISNELLKVAKDFSTVSEQTKQVVLLNRDNIDRIISDMTLVASDLKATAKEVRRNPWRLMYTPTEKEAASRNIYDAARAYSNGAEQLNEAISRLSSLAKAAPNGVPANDPQVQKIRKQIEEAFENFSRAEQSLWKELTNK